MCGALVFCASAAAASSACSMPAWMSAISDGRVATACRMSLAALSTASSNERACPSDDSAACTASTRPLCSPLTGLAARSRAGPRFWSAKASRSLAVVDVGGHRSQCGSVELVVQLGHSLFGGGDARGQFDDCWVRASSRDGALTTRSRISSKASRLRLQLAIGPRRRRRSPRSAARAAAPGSRVSRRRVVGAR